MVTRQKQDLISLVIVVAVLAVLNFLASLSFTRIDFTSEKRYTLSTISKDVIAQLDDKLTITVYLEGDFPSGFKRLRNSTFDFLSEMEAVSDGKMEFNFVNPGEGDTETQQKAFEQLLSKGIEPTNLSVKTEEGMSQRMVFPAALITYKDKSVPVKLLLARQGTGYEEVLNNSIENLEYTFTSAIRKVSSGGVQRIGFTEGHDELNDQELSGAMTALSDFYEVGRVDLKSITFAGLDQLNLLIIAKPRTKFSELEKFKIDYFLMKGGRILWSLDQVNADLDSLRKGGDQVAFANELNLDDQLFKYGVRLNYDLLADMNAAQIPVTIGNAAGQPQIQLLPWLFYPVLVPFSDHPLVKSLDGIRSEFPGTIDLLHIPEVRSQVILTSSPFNQVLKVPVTLSLSMLDNEPDPEKFKSAPKVTGAVLEGSFQSVFKNRPIPPGITEMPEMPFKSKAGKMIVFSDGDIFKSQVNATDGSPYPLGFDRYTQVQYGNANLLLNAVDYLIDDSGIIGLRGKEVTLRLLDRARVREEKSYWQALNFAVPIIVLIVLGIFQHYYRRHKYAR